MNQCICIISSRSILQSKFHSLQYYRYTSTYKRELKQCCYESIKIGDSSQWIGTRGGGSKVYRRSSGAKGNHLAETAGVWKSAAIRQTSLAPADYLKPPLCTPTPTPTISFPKSVARIIKLVEESSGGLLPSPPILVRQPPSSSSLSPASFTYAPLRPSDSISLLFSLPLSLSAPSLPLSLFSRSFHRVSVSSPLSMFLFFRYLSLSLHISFQLAPHSYSVLSSCSFSPSMLFLLPLRTLQREENWSTLRFGLSVASHVRIRNLLTVNARPQEVVQLDSCTA